MKKVIIAAAAAASMMAGIGAAQADGTDPHETQLFRDRGANIVTPENPRAPAPYMSQSRQWNFNSGNQRAAAPRGTYPMNGGYGDTLEN
jgi:hypothetical protein